MPAVRLVTCGIPDPGHPHLAAALSARGIDVDIAMWHDGAVDWSDAALTLVRSPWDYVDQLDAFLAWATHVATVSALWNPVGLITWNTHKSYLLELAGRGAPIVPTVMLTDGGAASLDGIADAQGWNTVVVKPAVGVGGQGAGRFDAGDAAGQRHLDQLLDGGDVLVQQYAAGIETDGEMSVVVIDGEATHGVRKRPAPGDYRVNDEYGGTYELAEPTAGLLELAARVCSSLPEEPLYGRVDVVPMRDGWRVIEVEVTEPFLFLQIGPPAATDRLVDAVMSRLA